MRTQGGSSSSSSSSSSNNHTNCTGLDIVPMTVPHLDGLDNFDNVFNSLSRSSQTDTDGSDSTAPLVGKGGSKKRGSDALSSGYSDGGEECTNGGKPKREKTD